MSASCIVSGRRPAQRPAAGRGDPAAPGPRYPRHASLDHWRGLACLSGIKVDVVKLLE